MEDEVINDKIISYEINFYRNSNRTIEYFIKYLSINM